MNSTSRRAHGHCIVVADSGRARLFMVEVGEDARSRLVEQADLVNTDYLAHGPRAAGARSERNTDRQAGPMHPQFEQRAHHRLELQHRFAREIVEGTAALVRGWRDGAVTLVAPAHMLGELRELMRSSLAPGLTFQELAREYTALSATQLAKRLGLGPGSSQRGRP
jgi:protein required for attachment to host cells